jgi:hypothetical protein
VPRQGKKKLAFDLPPKIMKAETSSLSRQLSNSTSDFGSTAHTVKQRYEKLVKRFVCTADGSLVSRLQESSSSLFYK